MSFTLPNLDYINLQGKNILMRADLNVPIKEGKIIDKTRIYSILPTIKKILKNSGKIILITHFGRPKGKIQHDLSVQFLQKPLEEICKSPVFFSHQNTGEEKNAKIKSLKEGEILLLENLRFNPLEELNNKMFAKELAQNIDFYINDAFSVSHRAHASVEAITNFLPSYAGVLLEKEVSSLIKILKNPKRPLAAIISGSKVSTKLMLLTNLIKQVDTLILGGGIAHTFSSAKGFNLQNSLVEKSMIKTAEEILASNHSKKIILPTDGLAAKSIHDLNPRYYKVENLPLKHEFLDLGKESVKKICKIIDNHKTLVWNGPLGVFENPPFDKSTTFIANYVANLTKENKIYSLAGGGETLACLKHAGVKNKLSHTSTAGGAFLEWLEGKQLPGIQALLRECK